jgi:hypothetical protein
MKSPAEFPWHTMGPKMRQFMEERLRDTQPLWHTRVSVLTAVGMGVGGFCLALVVWWLTASPRVPAPPTTLPGIELHQMLSTLQTMLADPTLATLSPWAAAPLTLNEVHVDVHFVVQRPAPSGGAPLYRLVPVDSALQTRPEHVQTLSLRLTAPPPVPTMVGTPGAAPSVPQSAEEEGLRKPTSAKKRAKPS